MKSLLIIILITFLTGCGIAGNLETNKNEFGSGNLETNKNEFKTGKEVLNNLYEKYELNTDVHNISRDYFNYILYSYNPGLFTGENNQICIHYFVNICENNILFNSLFYSTFNNFNNLDISSLVSSKDVLNSNLNKIYNYKTLNNVLFFNKNKNYLFSLNNFYEMNGICLIINNKIDSFFDFNLEKVSNEDKVGFKEYLTNVLVENKIKLKDYNLFTKNNYNSFIKNKYNYNDRKYIYLGLLSILDKYQSSGFDKKYLYLFYRKFNDYLNINYSYEEFTLYFLSKQYEGKMVDGFCDKFNREYFLDK